MDISPRLLLDAEFPKSFRSLFVPTIRQADMLARQALQGNNFLNWQLGMDFFPHIRRLAVEFEVRELVKRLNSQQLSCKVAPNKNCGYHHVELHTPKCVLTLSQVDTPNSLPRFAEFRNVLNCNQLRFKFDEEEVHVSPGPYYTVLTYGPTKGEISFAMLGFPEQNKKQFIYRVNLFNELTKVMPEEHVTAERMVQFQQEYLAELQGAVKSGKER